MDGLTLEQEQEFQRATKVGEYLALNQTVVNTFPPLLAKQTALSTALTDLAVTVSGKLIDTTGITGFKNGAKITLGAFYESVCGVCKSYLMETNQWTLVPNFNVTKQVIVGLSDGEVLPLIIRINKWIQDDLLPQPLFSSYGITLITLSDGTNLANAFVTLIAGAPAIEAQKTSAGKEVENELEKISDIIYSMSLLVKSFIITNTGFYIGFIAANKIDDIGVHHSGIRGDVLAAAPIANAVIACSALNKSTTSNLLGVYELIKMKAGLYEFTCTPPSLPPQTKIIQIKLGKILEIDWQF